MISRISQGGQIQYGVYDFVLDSTADLVSLPGLDHIKAGSTAFVIETSQYYMINHAGAWVKVTLATNNPGGGGGGTTPDDNYDGGEVIPGTGSDDNYNGGEVG